jgi:hypothetical protein
MWNNFYKTLICGVICAMAVLSFDTAMAQESLPGDLTSEDVGVMDRPRPEYDAKGIPLGAFRLFPSLDVTGSYDDNVFRQTAGLSDFYLVEAPTARVQSQWGRHFAELYAGLNNYNYSKYTQENLTDWDVGGDGRIDASRAATLSGGGSYGEAHESLQSPNTVGFQASPNRYYKTHGEANGTYQPNRLGFGAGGSIDRFDWNATPEVGGGQLFNTDRNETEYQAYAKTFYDFSPGYTGFLKASYDSREFDQFLDRTGLHRSSTGYRVDGGADVQISHLVKGEIFVGYLEQHYAQNVVTPLHSISGLDYGANLDWYADQKLTVHLKAAHTITDVTLASVSASNDQTVNLGADYEVAYNMIFQGYASYTQSHFAGTTRTDDYPGAGIKLRYLANEYLSAYVGYDYTNRSSNFSGINFNDNLITVGITGHL